MKTKICQGWIQVHAFPYTSPQLYTAQLIRFSGRFIERFDANALHEYTEPNWNSAKPGNNQNLQYAHWPWIILNMQRNLDRVASYEWIQKMNANSVFGDWKWKMKSKIGMTCFLIPFKFSVGWRLYKKSWQKKMLNNWREEKRKIKEKSIGKNRKCFESDQEVWLDTYYDHVNHTN